MQRLADCVHVSLRGHDEHADEMLPGPELPQHLEAANQALQISQGEVSALWSEPVAVVTYVVIALMLIASVVLGRRSTSDVSEVGP